MFIMFKLSILTYLRIIFKNTEVFCEISVLKMSDKLHLTIILKVHSMTEVLMMTFKNVGIIILKNTCK